MHKTIKVAVIGAGKLGSRHAAVYAQLPGVELVGVCDINEGRAREAARECRTRAFSDYHELLGLVDAASIVVPSHLHYPISRDFLVKGAHLLVEKPFTTSLADADKLLEIARQKSLTLQVGHIERFNSAVRSIKDIVKNPRFIECHRLGPYDARVAATGVTLDLMIHDIDIVLDFVKSPIRSVESVGAFIRSKTEDIANARILFENGTVCDLTASRVTKDVSRKIRIFQDNAYLSIDYVTQEVIVETCENGLIQQRAITIDKTDSLRDELTDFVDCVRHKKRPLVSGEEGRRALELALKISEQIEKNIHHSG